MGGKYNCKGRSNLAGRSLVKRRQESQPALISVIFSFPLRVSGVEYHWLKSGKGEKSVTNGRSRIYNHFIKRLRMEKLKYRTSYIVYK